MNDARPVRCSAPHPMIMHQPCRQRLADVGSDVIVLAGVVVSPGAVTVRRRRCGSLYALLAAGTNGQRSAVPDCAVIVPEPVGKGGKR